MAVDGQFKLATPDKGLTLKTEEFSNYLRELRAELGKGTTMKTIIDHEVARVLEKTIEDTEAADRTKIRERQKNRTTFKIDGRNWTTRNYQTGQAWRVPNAIWREIQAKRQRALRRKLGKVGLAKNSWYLLAEKLGQAVRAPGYVKNAKATIFNSGGANNVSVIRQGDGSNYGLTIINKMPILRFNTVKGLQALFGAMAGRIGAFRQNLKRGVFEDAAKIAKKYKGIKVGM